MEMLDVNHQTFATMWFKQWKGRIDPVKNGICAVRHGDSPVKIES